MKTRLVGILFCLLSACSKPPSAVVSPESKATPTPTPTPRLAPTGIYFTTEYMSVQSSNGVTGIPPGTRVELLKDMGEVVRITTGQLELDAKKYQLTNDLDVATQVSNRDAATQQQIAFAQTVAANSINVMQATYGYGDRWMDVANKVKASVLAGEKTVRAGNHLAGSDPAPGKVKTLTIVYSVGGSAPVTASVREGESISLGSVNDQRESGHDYSKRRADVKPRSAQSPWQNPLEKGAPSPWQNPLERGAYNRTQDKTYTDGSGRTYWIDVRGRRHYETGP